MATKTRTWVIKSGPSKYDFLETIGFRKWPEQVSRFQVQELKGETRSEGEVTVCLISKKFDPSNASPGSEKHLWGFYGTLRITNNSRGVNSFVVLGEYSTKTREGMLVEVPDRVWNESGLRRLCDMPLI